MPPRRGRKRKTGDDIPSHTEPETSGNDPIRSIDFAEIMRVSGMFPDDVQEQDRHTLNSLPPEFVLPPVANTDHVEPFGNFNTVSHPSNHAKSNQTVVSVSNPFSPVANPFSPTVANPSPPVAATVSNPFPPMPTPLAQTTSMSQVLPAASSMPINQVRLPNDEVYGHIPMALREKIWRGQHVNLALLLRGTGELEDFYSGGSLCLSDSGSIETKPCECKSQIANIEQWTDAFLIYMAIYIVDRNEEAPSLIKYMNNIREAARNQTGFAWRKYDELFRARREVSFTPWGEVNMNLWWRASLRREDLLGQKQALAPVSSKPTSVKAVFPCMDFNKGNCNWQNCRFNHVCSFCKGTHPLVACLKKPREMLPPNPSFRPNQNKPRFPKNTNEKQAGNFTRSSQ